MQIKLSAFQEMIQHDWFKDLTTQEILCVVGYYLIGISGEKMSKAMGFKNDKGKKVIRIANRGADKAHIYIRTEKEHRNGLESDEGDRDTKQKRPEILE